jgi:hypothetical protein
MNFQFKHLGTTLFRMFVIATFLNRNGDSAMEVFLSEIRQIGKKNRINFVGR